MARARQWAWQHARGMGRAIVQAARDVFRQRWRVGVLLGPWVLAIAISVPLLWTKIEETQREARVTRSADIMRGATDLLKRVFDRLGRDILFLGVLTSRLPEREMDQNGLGVQLFTSFAASSPDYD